MRKQEFEMLISALSLNNGMSSSDTSGSSGSGSNPLSLPRPSGGQIKAVMQPPPPLQRDASYQDFRDWRRRFEDYGTMTDLANMDMKKQYVQLRLSVSPEVLHIL